MGDVDQGGVWTNADRDTLHRAGVMVARAEVGEQGDHRAHPLIVLQERAATEPRPRGQTINISASAVHTAQAAAAAA